MSSHANLQMLVIVSVVLFAWTVSNLVKHLKKKKINTELWCTVFEGLTQGAIRLDHLKNPQAAIIKKVKRDGQDKDYLEAWLERRSKSKKRKAL